MRWVPLTGEPGGDHLCMDLAPAAGGRAGQVILWHHDGAPKLVAPTYEAWWGQLAAGLYAGSYRVDREGVLVRVGSPEDAAG